MDFKLDFGPWETVFIGQAYGHEVEIVSNPEHFFIVLIYDKREGRKIGAVVEGYKAYYAKGLMEAFIQTFPKPSFGMEKTFGDKVSKVFFLSFDPFYVDFFKEDFTRKIDSLIQKTEENASTILDLARASSLDLKELSTVPKADYASLLGDPFTLKSLASGQRPADLSKLDLAQNSYSSEESDPIIQLGLSKTREIILERAGNLKRTQIIGKDLALQYSLYILAENFLLEDIPVIVFDSTNYFDGLSTGTPDTPTLKDELVDFEPIGFPVRRFVAKEAIKISMMNTDLFFLLDLIGLKDNEFQKNLSLFAFTSRVNTPKELIENILQTKELSEYEKLRAERILNIIGSQFSGCFGVELSSDELTKEVPGKLGRAVIIDTKELSKDEKILYMHSVIRQLTKGSSQTQATNANLLLPEAQLLFEQNPEKASIAIMRLENRGLGIVLGVESEIPEELAQTMSAKINIVTGKDLAVSIKGKRNYRVLLRPSLSGSPKV